jgi:hypothetical protein
LAGWFGFVLDGGWEIGWAPAKSARGLGALQDALRARGEQVDRAVALTALFNAVFTVLKLHGGWKDFTFPGNP